MAKALRDRVGKRYKGTQGTRKLYTVDVVESWRNGSYHKCPLSREPCAVKVACTVVCPAKAGVFSRRKTYQEKSQSPVARRAGGRETNLLKPLDSLIRGMGA